MSKTVKTKLLHNYHRLDASCAFLIGSFMIFQWHMNEMDGDKTQSSISKGNLMYMNAATHQNALSSLVISKTVKVGCVRGPENIIRRYAIHTSSVATHGTSTHGLKAAARGWTRWFTIVLPAAAPRGYYCSRAATRHEARTTERIKGFPRPRQQNAIHCWGRRRGACLERRTAGKEGEADAGKDIV